MDKKPVELPHDAAKALLESIDFKGPSSGTVIIYSDEKGDFFNDDLIYGLFGISIALDHVVPEGISDLDERKVDCLGGMASALVVLSSLLVRRMGSVPIPVKDALDKIVQAYELGGAS